MTTSNQLGAKNPVRKKEAVLRLLQGEAIDSLSRELGVNITQLEKWKATVLQRMELMLKDYSEEPLAEELEAAKKSTLKHSDSPMEK